MPPLLGCLPRREQIELPQRHLGLVTAEDLQPERDFVGQLASWVEDHLDLDLLLQIATDSEVGFEHGASDARFLSAHGIKGIVWGADGDMSQHSADEHINIDSLHKLYDLLEAFINQSQTLMQRA